MIASIPILCSDGKIRDLDKIKIEFIKTEDYDPNEIYNSFMKMICAHELNVMSERAEKDFDKVVKKMFRRVYHD